MGGQAQHLTGRFSKSTGIPATSHQEGHAHAYKAGDCKEQKDIDVTGVLVLVEPAAEQRIVDHVGQVAQHGSHGDGRAGQLARDTRLLNAGIEDGVRGKGDGGEQQLQTDDDDRAGTRRDEDEDGQQGRHGREAVDKHERRRFDSVGQHTAHGPADDAQDMRTHDGQDTGKGHGHTDDVGHVGIEIGSTRVDPVTAEDQQGDDPGHGFLEDGQQILGLEFVVLGFFRAILVFSVEKHDYGSGKQTSRALHVDDPLEAGHLVRHEQPVYEHAYGRDACGKQAYTSIEEAVETPLLSGAPQQADGLDDARPERKCRGKGQQYPDNHGHGKGHVGGKENIEDARTGQGKDDDPLGTVLVSDPSARDIQAEVHDRVDRQQQTGLLVRAVDPHKQLIIKDIFDIGEHETRGVPQRQRHDDEIASERTHTASSSLMPLKAGRQ